MPEAQEDGRVVVVIPARNEGESVARVAQAARLYSDSVIVVDGHSTDGSIDLVRKLGIAVVADNGLGKGEALRCGFAAASGEFVVTMDADCSHEPADIPRLLEPLRTRQADLVIGCRMRGGSDEFAGGWDLFVRLWGNNVLTMVINTRFGVRLTDSQNGFRAARLSMLRSLDLKEDRHAIELEMVMKALKKGYRVEQVPSHEYCRTLGKSSLSIVRQTPRFLWCLLSNLS